MIAQPAPRRGAVRSEAARAAILAATAARFASHGYANLSIEGIAAQAGVGKQTIYRWWPSKAALVAECLWEGMLLPASLVPADTGDLRADLTAWIAAILRFTGAPESSALMYSLLAAAASDEQVGLGLRDALGAESPLQARLRAAVAAGDLRADAPLREITDALVGAVILRVLSRSPAEPDSASRLVAAVLPR
ncbi:MAG: TetR/AcrR family transcriptional regulator [Candidatus Nanopelagicales bacterium]